MLAPTPQILSGLGEEGGEPISPTSSLASGWLGFPASVTSLTYKGGAKRRVRAPHSAFGHLLPAAAGRRATLLLLLLLAANCNRTPIVETPVNSQAPSSQAKEPEVVPKDLNVVTLGDSLAYGAGDETGRGIAGRLKNELLDRGLSEAETVNLGVNGAQTGDVLSRLKQERVRNALAKADAIVLSAGANDLFRSPGAREETLRNPLIVAERILDRIAAIVAELHTINPNARILILGGYNPVPNHPMASMIDQYLGLWDAGLAGRFEDEPRVTVVKMSDIVTRQRLSRYDSFHPGGQAYAEAAKRIAEMLV